MEVDKLDHEIRVKEQEEEEEEEEEEVFIPQDQKELYDVRLEVLNYSLKQSAIRLQKLRQLKQSTTTTTPQQQQQQQPEYLHKMKLIY